MSTSSRSCSAFLWDCGIECSSVLGVQESSLGSPGAGLKEFAKAILFLHASVAADGGR